MSDLYPQVQEFAALMRHEMQANAHKGDDWAKCSPREILSEITWHWAKLVRAVRDHEDALAYDLDPAPHEGLIREYAADVANGSLMLLDGLGILTAHPSPCEVCGAENGDHWVPCPMLPAPSPEEATKPPSDLRLMKMAEDLWQAHGHPGKPCRMGSAENPVACVLAAPVTKHGMEDE